MAGFSALRAGAGLSTVATPKSVLATVAGFHPELMTEPLPKPRRERSACARWDRIWMGCGTKNGDCDWAGNFAKPGNFRVCAGIG